MRETTLEIKKVFDKHSYSIDSIVFDVMQIFKLNSIVRHTRFEKQEGYAVTEILALLILFPLMLVSSVNGFFHRASLLRCPGSLEGQRFKDNGKRIFPQ